MERHAPWWAEVPPASAEIECGDALHTVHWRNGTLVLDDHDLLAEEALAALDDADVPSCLELVWTWRTGFSQPALPINLGYYMPLARGAPDYEGSLQRCIDRHESLKLMSRAQVPGVTAGVPIVDVYRHAARLCRPLAGRADLVSLHDRW